MEDKEIERWRDAVLGRFWIAFNAHRLEEARFFGHWYYCLGPTIPARDRHWWKRCGKCGTPRPTGQIMRGWCADCIISENKRKVV